MEGEMLTDEMKGETMAGSETGPFTFFVPLSVLSSAEYNYNFSLLLCRLMGVYILQGVTHIKSTPLGAP